MSAAAPPPGAAAAAAVKARGIEREVQRREVQKAAATAIELSEEVENNTRACVGIQVASMIENQRHLVGAVESLQRDVRDIERSAAAHAKAYAGFVRSIGELGSLASWLKESEHFLAEAGENMAFCEAALGGS